jgi:UDP-glucose 4-epimerase
MRILVTGGAGFIGSHLVERLAADGHDVTVLDSLSTGKRSNLSSVLGSKGLVIKRADIRRIPRSLAKNLGKVDRVCHLAAMTSVQGSIKHPVLTSEVNLIGTLRVLEVARKHKAERVVFASSAAVYGSPRTVPITEGANTAPVSPYGASKAASELYCRSFEENHGIEAVSLRYFNVYGPRQRSGQYSGVISIFSRRIHQKLPLRIFGDGSQSRDFVFVSDAVAGTIAALEKEHIQSRIFNIASGRETTILQLARTMQEVAKGAPSNLRFEPARKGEVYRSLADVTRAQTELGYSPTVPLHDGLSKTMKWFAEDRT